MIFIGPHAGLSGRTLSATLIAILVFALTRAVAKGQATAPSAAESSSVQPTTAPATSGGSGTEVMPVVPRLGAIELFRRAGFFIWPLAACSVLSVALIIERFIALRRARVLPPGFSDGLRQVLLESETDRQGAIRYCERNDSPLARTIVAGIRRLPRGYAAAEKAIEDAGANEALKLRQNMRFLYSLGSVATLLGLIGTIWGMIKAFQVASIMGPGHTDQLSEGIYEAMVNTFAGLAVAIVVTIFYYYFAGRIERLVGELNDSVNEFGRDAGFDSVPSDEVHRPAAGR